MDICIEERFVNCFVIKNKRNRVMYELNNPKKRSDCLFNIRYKIMIDRLKILKHVSSETQLYEMLHNEGFRETCYVIAEDIRVSDIYSTKQAISITLGSMTRIMYDELNDIAFFDDEEYNKCLLQKN